MTAKTKSIALRSTNDTFLSLVKRKIQFWIKCRISVK